MLTSYTSVGDCSLFMPKGGGGGGRWFSSNSGIWKIYPSPEVGILKNYAPPFMWRAQNVTPPTPTSLHSERDVPPITKLCTTRVLAGQPMNQNPLQGHLWSYSMEALNKESEFATLHVMFQCPWITLHEFLSGDEKADQLRLGRETVSALLKSMDKEYDRSILRSIISLLHTLSDPTLARRKIEEVIAHFGKEW